MTKKTWKVSNNKEFIEIMKKSKPGDTIIFNEIKDQNERH
jgi:hypothetical protein